LKLTFALIVLGLVLCAAKTETNSAAQPPAPSQTPSAESNHDTSGTWVAKRSSPMGEMEIVYKLEVHDGKITGTQVLPFGDSPIIDGQITGESFHLTVEVESFGSLQKKEVIGQIVGDRLVLTPAMPGPPPGGGAGPPGPPAGMPGPGGPPSGAGPGGAASAGGPPRFQMGPLTFRRGTPTPSYRAPFVDYTKLPRLSLPALHPIPANGLAKTPPMGWNSWNKFASRVDDAGVRAAADALVSTGMKDAGYIYVNIDDTWQGERDAQGNIQANKKFPDMKALSAYVHGKGLKIGIYSSPGPNTCAGYEGSHGHEVQDAHTYAAWGIDYLKYDWCGARNMYKDSEMPALYQIMGDALQASGRQILYSLCQYGRDDVWKWGPDVGGNLWRTTGDIRDAWDSMSKIGFSQSDLAPYAAPGHWNDPDMLEIGNGGMSTPEYQTHMSLWALLAAPLLAGNDLQKAPPEILAILTNRDVIAIDQDRAGKQATRVFKSGDYEVWSKELANGEKALGIFNRGPNEVTAAFKWTDAGLKKSPATGRDLWLHQDVKINGNEYSTAVASHGVVLLRVRE
jgi:alpha-galactosidase